ncbi:peptidase S10 [Arthrobacter sp. zg-Y1143]|uniref:S10 family peptidase n=1 Tax=Arthrobacter sp. zg-Y1143 TaxID=3049065 RepID=UPI0024C28DFE|nr:peptidase S10 [Arthrobacter sp. zg-Y1143]MDK1326549.1 peptidase S10 [Arthrobacter sp. zg-Y1143]
MVSPEHPEPPAPPASGISGDGASSASSASGTAAAGAKVDVSDDFAVRRHTLPSGREYTTTAGRLVFRKEEVKDGKSDGFRPKAEIFMVAYTADAPETGPNRRPVVFAFNGGPGSASVWLHMGLLGPRMVVSGDAGALAPPPFGLVDNPDTLLEHADLVMIDPVNTGFSRVVDGNDAGEFHGFEEDRDLVAEVIRLWTTRNNRWLSPKYLVGESYGTLRAVAVAGKLFDAYGLAVNGLGLVSTVLNMATLDFAPGRDTPYPLHLPTYAAIAHYHGRHPGRELADVVREAEEYASGDYVLALHKGSRLGAQEYDDVVRRLAEITTLSEGFIRRTNLRWDYSMFSAELLREENLAVGRIDGRFTAAPAHQQDWINWDDPSMTAINGPYSAAVNHYLRAELGYENDLPYEILTGRVRPWSYKSFEGVPVDVTGTLERLLVHIPALRVHVDYGYYDGATPHFAAEYVWAHLRMDDAARARFSHHYYEAGHMMYVKPECRVDQLRNLAEFVTAAE